MRRARPTRTGMGRDVGLRSHRGQSPLRARRSGRVLAGGYRAAAPTSRVHKDASRRAAERATAVRTVLDGSVTRTTDGVVAVPTAWRGSGSHLRVGPRVGIVLEAN